MVEDQEAVRELTKTVLEAYGYYVLEATNGVEALAFVEQHSEEIHLLLTDVIMPGMNGMDLSRRLRVLRPKLKVLFTSGYPAEVIARRGVVERDVAYLPKPVSPDDPGCEGPGRTRRNLPSLDSSADPAPQSPRNFPNGRSPLTLSQTALIPAVSGIASSSPGASHRKPQIISENVTTSGFR